MTRGHHIASLDAFRGFAVAGMILVDNPGNWNTVFESLAHAEWNGCTVADVVFPFFIFILGAAMPFAFARRLQSGQQTPHLFNRIMRRTVWLVALGLSLNVVAAFPMLRELRFPGVLQRIGAVYLITAPLVLSVGLAGRAGILVLIALGHWALLAVWSHGGALTASNNVAAAIDRAVFGSHLLTATGDPEGILGTLTSIGTALLGSIAGDCLRRARSPQAGIRDLILIGVASMAAGLIWALALPLNKSLWTGSFVMWTGGLAALILAGCFWLMDVEGHRSWARPFVWLGFNPLAIYFVSELVSHLFDKPWLRVHGQTLTVRSWLFWDVWRPVIPGIPDEWLSLGAGLAMVALWTALAGFLYRRGVRLQV
ncbi:MAG TPA: DUF5009 domain-containing protein [Vicinamibacterales bacterium]